MPPAVRAGSETCTVSGGTGVSASSARLVLSIASAPRTSPTSARAVASSRATSTSARSTSDCGAVPLAYRAFAARTTSRAKAICSFTSAAVRRRSCSMRWAIAASTATSSVVRVASARSRSISASADARRCPRIPDNGICCSIVKLTSAPSNENGRWSSALAAERSFGISPTGAENPAVAPRPGRFL
jgi:hypothetical protein